MLSASLNKTFPSFLPSSSSSNSNNKSSNSTELVAVVKPISIVMLLFCVHYFCSCVCMYVFLMCVFVILFIYYFFVGKALHEVGHRE